MEKSYKCAGCSKDFAILRKLDHPVYGQHEVEMNVECPYCSKTNAIVWPQDESPLVVPSYGENSGVKPAAGDFYVQAQCCLSCGVPQAVAPDLVGWTNETHRQCYWIKQPQTSDELDRAIKLIHSQELGCHRYSGTEPDILRRLPAEDCDHLRPDLKLQPHSDIAWSGPSPKFTLSASGKDGLLTKLWRRLRG